MKRTLISFFVVIVLIVLIPVIGKFMTKKPEVKAEYEYTVTHTNIEITTCNNTGQEYSCVTEKF